MITSFKEYLAMREGTRATIYTQSKAAGVKQVPAIIIAPENIRREKVWTPEQ